jgi:hypothetical protein
MVNDKTAVIFIVVALLLGLGSGAFYLHQYQDCNAKGGVLVKNAYDWPTCVSMTTR